MEDQPTSVLTVTSVPVMPAWDPTYTVVDALKIHSEMGDVQTSVSVLLVLGDLRLVLYNICTIVIFLHRLTAIVHFRNSLSPYLDEVTQEHWLVGYLDLLARHKLWDVCTLVSLLITQQINKLSNAKIYTIFL